MDGATKAKSPLEICARRARREYSALNDAEKRARARKDERQLSIFGGMHTRELRRSRAAKRMLDAGRASCDVEMKC